MENIEHKTKFRFIMNSPLAYVHGEDRDKVLGYIIKNPGIMTRKYTEYVDTELFKTCPNCNQESGQLIYH